MLLSQTPPMTRHSEHPRESNCNQIAQFLVSIYEPMFHQTECTLEVCGIAVWVEVFYDEMRELSNVVVAFRAFSLPQFKVLLPSEAKPGKLSDQARHDLRFAWPIVAVESPIRVAAHSRQSYLPERILSVIRILQQLI